jgi:rod shape-determining protein MreD
VTGQRVLFGAVLVSTALLLQTAVLARLPLPGGTPDLLLVVVVAFALAEGPLAGTLTGFAAGLLADLGADHEVGRLALVHLLVGYGAGLLSDEAERSTVLPFVVVAGAAAAAVAVYAGEGVLLGDPRITAAAFWRSLRTTVAYSVLLTPFVVPVVASLLRRLEPDSERR